MTADVPVMKVRNSAATANAVCETREAVRKILNDVVEVISLAKGEVAVSYMIGEKTTVYRIQVPENSRGRLIGASGKTITSLRVLLTSMCGAHGFRGIIDVVL